MIKGEKMCSGVARWKLGVLTTAVSLFLGSNIAMAQSQADYIVPPIHSPLDKNGVNLATGTFQKSSALLSLGNPEFSGIAVSEQRYGSAVSGANNGLTGTTNSLTNYLQVITYAGGIFGWNAVYNGNLYTFIYTSSQSGYVSGYSSLGDGSSLSIDNANSVYTMTTSNGTVVQYNGHVNPSTPTTYSRVAVATQVTEPNGRVTRFAYKFTPGEPNGNYNSWLVSAANNLGYQIRVIDTSRGSGFGQYYQITAFKGINGSVEYCDRLALTCPSLSNAWPTANYAYELNANNWPTRITVTDATGAATAYGSPNTSFLTSIKTPASAVDNISISYKNSQYVASYSDGVSSYAYDFVLTYSGLVGTLSGIITGPGGYQRAVTGNYASGFLLTDQDALGRTTSYTKDGNSRLTKIVRPEGNSENWTYDDRGNITEYRVVAKAGSGLEDIVATAGYDATCANPKTCNKPNWVRDPKQNQTDFTYDPAHGGVLTETRPADTNGIRPKTRHAYAQRYAWVKNSTGGYSQAESPVWVKTEERTCRTSATTSGNTCAVTGDEVVTAYDYGPNSGPNNLLLRGVAVTADGQTRRTCFAYDAYGNKISETKPLANLTACP